jgi:uncharacterized phage-associated protein
MIVEHHREKLIQAVVFFASRVRKLGKIKLFKLLYFLDFQHYRDTGRSVTGLDYFAWKMGPVPVALFEELDAPRGDWHGRVTFEEVRTAKGPMFHPRAEVQFDATHFTKRELALMESLAREFRDANAEDMVEATHLENLPRQQEIPYDYALRKQDRELLKEFIAERQKFVAAFKR